MQALMFKEYLLWINQKLMLEQSCVPKGIMPKGPYYVQAFYMFSYFIKWWWEGVYSVLIALKEHCDMLSVTS